MSDYKTPDYQRKATAKYAANNIKSYSLCFNIRYDADILDYLESIPNKQGFIKDCIRHDIYGVVEQ